MNQRGFTFTEILIVLGVLLLFSAFFVVVVNPIHRIQEARDNTREAHINTILLGVEQKLSKERDWNCSSGPLPQDKFTAIGTGPGEYDLYGCLTPNYLSKYLVDPKEGKPSSGRDITDGLVGHWKFDEGEGITAYDASGNGNDGTLVNGPNWVDGKIGGALEFDGVDDYVEVDDNSIFAGDSVTISFWFKSTMTSSGSLVWKERIGSGGSYWIRMEPESNQIRVLFRDSSNNSANITTSQIYNNGEWHYFVVTYNGSSGQIYVDNEEDGSTFDSIYSWDSDESLYIGAQWGTESFFNGQIDDVRVYNRALSPEEIQDLYNYEYSSKYAIWQNPVTKNISLKSLESETKEVFTGAPEVALKFSETKNHRVSINMIHLKDNEPWTFSNWIYWNKDTHENYTFYAGSRETSRNLLLMEHNNKRFCIRGSNGYKCIGSLDGSEQIIERWAHLSWVHDGAGKLSLFLDGVFYNSVIDAGAEVYMRSFGSGYSSDRYSLSGLLSDVRIYDRALSAEEVEQLYKGYDIRNGLVGHWPLNEGQGTTAYDRSGNGNDGTLIGGPTWITK